MAGIPDSGIGHGLGYAAEAGLPFRRPFVKYTPTWARSFMPQNQDVRDQVARMKLIPIREIIQGKRLLFCEDSIVRGTQLKDTIQRLYDSGAVEVHMRPACPPLAFGCKYLNFSRSRSELDLAARQAIAALEGPDDRDFAEYAKTGSDKYEAMVEWICRTLSLTTLRYQRLEDLVDGHRPAEGEALHLLLGRRGDGLVRKADRGGPRSVRVPLRGPAIESPPEAPQQRLSIRASFAFSSAVVIESIFIIKTLTRLNSSGVALF